MTLIGVISDTHLKRGGRRQLPPQVAAAFAGVDLILHAGDLVTMQVVRDLEALAPVWAVHGNNDDGEIMDQLPATRRVTVEQCVIGLTHGDVGQGTHIRPWPDAPGNGHTAANAFSRFEFEDDVNCIVFGHSHRPLALWHQAADRRVLMFNPGSPTDRRFAPQFTVGLLRIDGRNFEAELVAW